MSNRAASFDPYCRQFHRLTKREGKRFYSRISELDLELPVHDGFRLSNQLIHPRLRNSAATLIVHINSVSCAGHVPIDEHVKTCRSSRHRRSDDQMEVAGMEAVGNAAIRFLQDDPLSLYGPITRQRPLIQF